MLLVYHLSNTQSITNGNTNATINKPKETTIMKDLVTDLARNTMTDTSDDYYPSQVTPFEREDIILSEVADHPYPVKVTRPGGFSTYISGVVLSGYRYNSLTNTFKQTKMPQLTKLSLVTLDTMLEKA